MYAESNIPKFTSVSSPFPKFCCVIATGSASLNSFQVAPPPCKSSYASNDFVEVLYLNCPTTAEGLSAVVPFGINKAPVDDISIFSY